MPVGPRRQIGHYAPPFDEAVDTAAGSGNLADVNRTVVDDREEERGPVG